MSELPKGDAPMPFPPFQAITGCHPRAPRVTLIRRRGFVTINTFGLGLIVSSAVDSLVRNRREADDPRDGRSVP
jgi:hypothetical protein